MNLVSHEFVACQDSKKGVLVLSEVNVIPSICFLLLHTCILILILFGGRWGFAFDYLDMQINNFKSLELGIVRIDIITIRKWKTGD